MPDTLALHIEHALHRRVLRITPLHGGCFARVVRADLAPAAGEPGAVVAKSAAAPASLDLEAYMLRFLAERSRLSVPRVLFSSPTLLITEHIQGASRFSDAAQRHAADLLADLHSIPSPTGAFGLDRATLIGSLHQPNPWTPSWVAFFRDHRLLHMAHEARAAGRLPRELMPRINRLAARLGDLIDEPARPSLIHGDVWATNVLASADTVTAFLDPAIYYAHPEIELAFITLFSTFGDPFFDRYHDQCPIAPGFFETRRHVYNLYPLLVHTRLFGGSYPEEISTSLTRLGF